MSSIPGSVGYISTVYHVRKTAQYFEQVDEDITIIPVSPSSFSIK